VSEGRYSRNEALFGVEGQEKIGQTKVGVVGLGGLGSHVVQQLACLGVASYALIDHDVVTESSLNRLIGAADSDIAAATPKVAVAERVVRAVLPRASVTTAQVRVEAAEVPPLLASVDVVFGCLDRDLPRLHLTVLCTRLSQPYFDLASDTGEDQGQPTYGGRVVFCDGAGCLFCLQLLDQEEMALDAMAPEHRQAHDRIYGVRRTALEGTGPSVVSVNGVVASLAVTEFMALVTGLRDPAAHLNYYGEKMLIRRSMDAPLPDCPYCTGLWGRGLELA